LPRSGPDENREGALESGAWSPEPREAYPVVWWAPSALALGLEPPVGVRREDLISKEAPPLVVADARSRYDAWVLSRSDAIAEGSIPSLQVRTITDFAHAGTWPASFGEMPPVDVIELPRDGTRPKGRRFGTLVHAVLATTPLDADPETLTSLARLEARILGAPDEEVTAAATLAAQVLAHPLLASARAADAEGKCRREIPVTSTLEDGRLLEGVVDLAWENEGTWTVVDFKTDEDPSWEVDTHRRQLAMYAGSIESLCAAVRATVLFI